MQRDHFWILKDGLRIPGIDLKTSKEALEECLRLADLDPGSSADFVVVKALTWCGRDPVDGTIMLEPVTQNSRG